MPGVPVEAYTHLANIRSKILSRIRTVIEALPVLGVEYAKIEIAGRMVVRHPREACFCAAAELPGVPENVDKITCTNRAFQPSVRRSLPLPAFFCIHDPEVVADVSLYGNRLQRFFPVIIQGWVSTQSMYDNLSTDDERSQFDARPPEERNLQRRYLGDSYIDMIIAALAMPQNIEYFRVPLAAVGIPIPNTTPKEYRDVQVACDGFSIERVGPAVVDEYPLLKDTTFMHVGLQTSFNVNVVDPRAYFGAGVEYEAYNTEEKAHAAWKEDFHP